MLQLLVVGVGVGEWAFEPRLRLRTVEAQQAGQGTVKQASGDQGDHAERREPKAPMSECWGVDWSVRARW